MKKILFIALLLMISGRVFATTFYEQYGCEYSCGTKYYETEKDSLGFTRKFVVMPCKYNFCYTQSGYMYDFKYNQFGKVIKGTYPFHFRFVTNY